MIPDVAVITIAPCGCVEALVPAGDTPGAALLACAVSRDGASVACDCLDLDAPEVCPHLDAVLLEAMALHLIR